MAFGGEKNSSSLKEEEVIEEEDLTDFQATESRLKPTITRNPKHYNHSHLLISFTKFLEHNYLSFASYGSQLADTGEYDRAIHYFSLSLAINNRIPEVWYNRAFCYFEIDQTNKAMKDIAECIKLNPCWPKAFLKMGQILTRLKQYPAAELTYNKALALDPNCHAAQMQIRGNIYEALVDQGIDKIKAGYASQRYPSIKEALIYLQAGEFEVDLYAIKVRKKREYRRLTFKKGKLIPINFYL
ncbi:uncharacterized protein LOC141852970 [Brevipalpus obovatus]|uniref:uncharacterized protein LOC141852970 n=1 Tax=Brevipalpus obovatus TaxID=246614 RepID=UPI003D9F19D3